jgi:hypothetical protein
MMKILVNSIIKGDYKQLVIPGTHVINDNESDNGSGEQQDVNKNWIRRSAKLIFIAKYRLISHFRRNILWCLWSPVQHC